MKIRIIISKIKAQKLEASCYSKTFIVNRINKILVVSTLDRYHSSLAPVNRQITQKENNATLTTERTKNDTRVIKLVQMDARELEGLDPGGHSFLVSIRSMREGVTQVASNPRVAI